MSGVPEQDLGLHCKAETEILFYIYVTRDRYIVY